jgi:glucose-6-phosphate dehydrogenase assembly protein OpcA
MSTPETAAHPHEQVVPFTKISAAMARGTCQDAGAMRALVATVVAVGPDDRLDAAAETLQVLGDAGTVRGILISPGDNAAPPARVAGNTVSLRGIKAPYLNNAVAALRLSSLPTLVWWRGGESDLLEGLAELADRIVLDEHEPEQGWRRAVDLFDRSAFSDLRWARLTQWRALMAHFFDTPEVRASAQSFTRLHIRAADRMTARLFASWLTSSLAFANGFEVEIAVDGAADADKALEEVTLGDGKQGLEIRLAGGRTCLETSVSVQGHRSASRVVSLMDSGRTGLMTEELRIRARDVALERTIRSLVKGA